MHLCQFLRIPPFATIDKTLTMTNKLHYIYDPLCGWCYAAEPLLNNILESPLRDRFSFEMHAGGLFQRMKLPESKRAMIRQADARIADMTGQIFGEAYLNGLLARDDTIYDSLPPIAAILAVGRLAPGLEPKMLQAIQHAHYREGLVIVQEETLGGLAGSLGIERDRFSPLYNELLDEHIQDHLDSTLTLMHYAGAQGFPAFVIQRGDILERLRHEKYYNDPAAFAALFADRISEGAD